MIFDLIEKIEQKTTLKNWILSPIKTWRLHRIKNALHLSYYAMIVAKNNGLRADTTISSDIDKVIFVPQQSQYTN